MTAAFIGDHSMIKDKVKFSAGKPTVHKIMDAQEFIDLVQHNRSKIKSAKILLPKLGSKGLGKFLVEFEV